jgi:PAS domain S-box-containing protein
MPKWLFDAETLRFLKVNRAAVHDYGYSRREFLAMKMTDLLTPEDHPLLLEYQEQLASDRELTGVWRHRRKDGTILYVRISSRRMVHEGKPACASVVYDVTERRLMEERLRLYQEIVKNIPIGLAVMRLEKLEDPETLKVLEFNPAARLISGGSRTEFTERLVSEGFLRPPGTGRPNPYTELLRTGKPRDLGEIHYAVDHSPEGSVSAKAFSLPNGHIGIVFEDITERRKVEEALEQSERQYRLLFQNNPQPMIVFDERSQEIIGVNDSAVGHYGYARDDFLSMTLKDLQVYPAAPDGFESIANLPPERSLGGELLHRRKDGSVMTVEATRYGTVWSGRAAELVLINDITERKRVESDLKASLEQLRTLAARLQSAREEERIRVAREVHDELGQVMAVVKMGLSTLSRSILEGGISSAQIAGELRSSEALLDGLIASVTKVLERLRPVVLDELGIVASIRWQVDEFQARTGIVCDMEAGVESLDLDRERATALFRILQESLTNIIRHSGATTARVEISVDGDTVMLDIRDNGRGISEAELNNHGSLGLLGIRERAIFLGGKCHIEGFPGRGTEVSVRIPLRGGT